MISLGCENHYKSLKISPLKPKGESRQASAPGRSRAWLFFGTGTSSSIVAPLESTALVSISRSSFFFFIYVNGKDCSSREMVSVSPPY